MKLGSHDSTSYGKPKQWWLRPFHFVARCQNKTIKEQFENYGIRLFDIRLRYNYKKKIWEFAHGFMTFDVNEDEVFDFLDSKGIPVYIRMLLEYNKEPKHLEEIKNLYYKKCENLRNRYKNLIFFGFNLKYNWEKLYSYQDEPNLDIHQSSSSTTLSIIDDWIPIWYAKTHNSDILKQGTSHDWLLMDFIGYPEELF